jgi:alpha-tubulin suppressor-like RCC1 family protein/tetratricopeptide (TPR) repeat protein
MGWSARIRVSGLVLALTVSSAVSANATIRFISLSAADQLTCGVADSGTLYCWGSDEHIFVEEGKEIQFPIPRAVAPEIRFRSVSIGSSILCGISDSGHAYCWGQAMAVSKPTLISPTLTFRSVSAGLLSACGVATDGAIFCWGTTYSHSNDVAEFKKNVPVRIKANTSFEVVSLPRDKYVGCGIARDGAGYCWGVNLGEDSGPEHSATVAAPIKGGIFYRTVSAGGGAALAVARDGIVYLWDYTNLGSKPLDKAPRMATIDANGGFVCGTDPSEIGYCWADSHRSGSGLSGTTSRPQQLFGNLKFSSITAGHYHACGLTNEGNAYCWGNHGELGNNLPGSWSIPTPVADPGATPIVEELDDGSKPFRSDLADVTRIQARLSERRELNSKRLIVMIEAKANEQLVGSGAGELFFTDLDRAFIITAYHLIRPEQKLPLSIKVTFWSKPDHPFEAKVTGDWDKSLDLIVLRVDGIGALGLDVYSMPFDQVRYELLEKSAVLYHLGNPGGRNWSSNAAPDHFLESRGPIVYFESSTIRPGVSGGALLDEQRRFVGMVRADDSGEGEAVSWEAIKNRLRDWGYPVYLGAAPPAPTFVSTAVLDRLNYGVTPDHDVYSWPEVPSDPGESISILNGLKFDLIRSDSTEWGLGICGLGETGDAYCWTTPYSEPGKQVLGDPVKVPGDKQFRALTVGGTVCGLTNDGQAFCWSRGNSALGDGSIRHSDSPIAIFGDAKFKSISSGADHTCGVDQGGDLYCWGENVKGDLGFPSAMSFDLPTRVPSNLKFQSVSSGTNSTCAISENGQAYCWGSNQHGQLGNGTRIDSKEPVEVSTPAKFQMISVGDSYACAVTTEKAALCWGLNGDGELGNNSFKSSSVPVSVHGNLQFSSVVANYSRTIGITTSGTTYTWGMQIPATDDTVVRHSSVPLPAPAGSDLASVEGIFAYRMDGDYAKAEQAADEALQKYPNSPTVVYEVARLFADTGKADRTHAGIQKLRDLGGDRIALLRFAQLELRIGDFDEMAKDLDRAQELSKGDDEIREVRMQRANSLSARAEYAAADAEYRKILADDPHNAVALNNLAYNLARENGPLQAVYDMAFEAVASDPENSDSLDTLGFICNRMSRFPEAQKYLEHALANQGVNDPDILEHLGDTYSQSGNAQGAQAMWRDALQRREAEAPRIKQPAIIERIKKKIASNPI